MHTNQEQNNKLKLHSSMIEQAKCINDEYNEEGWVKFNEEERRW